MATGWQFRSLFFLFLLAAPFALAQNIGQELETSRQVYFEKGARDALPLFQRVRMEARKQGDRKDEAIALGWLGNCYKRLGDYDKALDYLTKALAMKRALKDRAEEGRSLSHLGLLFWEMGRYKQAIADFNDSIRIGRQLGDTQLEASALNNLSLVYDELGEYTRSLRQYQRALQLDQASRFERGEADTLGNIGGVYLSLGRFNDAIRQYQKSLAISQRLNLKVGASQDLGNIALCQLGLGRLDESLQTFDRALQLAREAGLDKEQADWHKGKGQVLVREGKFDQARAQFDAANLRYSKAGLKRELVDGLSSRARMLAELGDTASADRDFVQAMDLAREIGFSRGVTDNLAAIGELDVRRGRSKEAMALYRSALQRAQAAGQRDIEAEALVLEVPLLCQEGHIEEAVRNSAKAVDIAHAVSASLIEAEAQFQWGEALLAGGQAKAALLHYSAAEPMARGAMATDLQWRVAYGRGRALETLHRNQAAVSAYETAIRIIESVRAQIGEDRFRSGYFQGKSDAYIRLVRLLIRLSHPGEAFKYSERLRARSYRELLQHAPAVPHESVREAELRARILQLERSLAQRRQNDSHQRGAGQELSLELARAEREYENLLDDLRSRQPAYVLANGLETLSLSRLQARLPTDTALLEYVVGSDAVSELVVRRQTVWATTVAVRQDDLESNIELMRNLIAQTDESWVLPAVRLRDLLITPAEKAGRLEGVRRLLIVPNGVLHYLPFAVLARSGEHPRDLLVEDYTIAYLPAAAALELHAGLPPHRQLLAVAPLPKQLRYTPQEVERVGQYFAAPRVLVGPVATKQALERHIDDFRFIHFATHSYFNKADPLLSSLQLGNEGQDADRLEVHEILDLNLHADLVTLSACDTALASGYFTELPAGDEFVGLTRAFLTAGSASVMASLWAVNDQSTVELMDRFYRNLGTEGRPAALAQAQRQMLHAGGAWSQPYYWAAFVLVDTRANSMSKNIPRKVAAPIRVSRSAGVNRLGVAPPGR